MIGDRHPEPIVPCAQLRTKMQYVAGPGDGSEWQRVSATAAYWCLCTMAQIGPDDGLVTPQHCSPRRRCFQTID
jgi:hypothetical protein